MSEDMEPLKERYGKGVPEFITGSSLEHLRLLPDGSFDMVITSPPYANRYDYTRTYALELAGSAMTRRRSPHSVRACYLRPSRTSPSWNF